MSGVVVENSRNSHFRFHRMWRTCHGSTSRPSIVKRNEEFWESKGVVSRLRRCQNSEINSLSRFLSASLRLSLLFQERDFEFTVLVISKALWQLKASEALQGLIAWCKRHNDRDFPWLQAMVLKSKGRLGIC